MFRVRSIIFIAALFTAALATSTSSNCTSDVGGRGFFPFAFKAFNDVTGQQAGAGMAFDSHNRQFRSLFAGTGLDSNGVIKATRLQSLVYFQLNSYGCAVYDLNNNTNQIVGIFNKALGFGDLEIYGGQETDVTDFIIQCNSLVIWYPKDYDLVARGVPPLGARDARI
ncbi:hypothetical protein BU23DRAFT_556125 [Bimuria novae-zelandiae CBS 107.79]|uniref:Uncharacterized protein n=1 Tax=Bimuria novae-zelandiae CBS 107.79 TaxID=1447943 RepID=A0A6A5V3X2_9PLEO|nr:hypothetical protein BU23DRAFT_556125 [Bimuria novae-zelandiae CBS 107.79]